MAHTAIEVTFVDESHLDRGMRGRGDTRAAPGPEPAPSMPPLTSGDHATAAWDDLLHG